MTRKVLGKGLNALIPKLEIRDIRKDDSRLKDIPVNEITPNRFQPRKVFKDEHIKELANSIKEKGIVQPIIVRKNDTGYELVAGERRLRAVKTLMKKTIRALIQEIDDDELLEIALIENIQRENLNPLEEAEGYQQLIDKYAYTQEKVAQIVGKERSTVTNFLRLLKLPGQIKTYISNSTLSMGHARALLGLETKSEQIRLGINAVSKGMSVRDTEKMVSGVKNAKAINSKSPKEAPDMFLQDIEEKLKKYLGTKVSVKKGKKGGKIEIFYFSDDEFERIYTTLIN